MTKHTPGPWRVERRPSAFDDDGIASVPPFGVFGARAATYAASKADAVLIAAAPDLLAACEEALRQYNTNEGCKLNWDAAALLRNAIAKAKGEK